MLGSFKVEIVLTAILILLAYLQKERNRDGNL